jgi:hypothetical protein
MADLLAMWMLLGPGGDSGTEAAPGSTTTLVGGRAEAVAWLRDSTRKDVVLLAPAPLAKSVRAAVPGRRVAAYDDASPRSADLIMLASTDAAPPGSLRQLMKQSPRIAVFRDGVEIRAVLKRSSPRRERAVQLRAGQQLVRHTNIRLTPSAWPVLAAGTVDPRLMGLLAHLSATHSIDIGGFPRDPAERRAHAPARTATITAIDGRLVGEASADSIRQMMTTLREPPPPFRPNVIRVEQGTSAALTVTFLLPSPAGLVPPPPGSAIP